ncbi:MAG: hypothetical protein V7751_05930 [Pseudoalteromonas distincta]|jgi:predicted transcriptional regulator
MSRNRFKSKGRAESGGFILFPHALYDHPSLASLSGNSTKVLLLLMRQYRGKNNGDLSASFTQAKKIGIGSKTTLAKALRELQEAGLVIRTREGYFTNPGGRCALYAVAWVPIDECPGKDLEVKHTTTAPLKLSSKANKKPGIDCGLS